ncbi:glycosyltransferase family 39 protein [Rhodococcus qingshengii]|uniref:Glycosyltransferase family 39 protein n=1 Tax=Rhodococcus qingshengii TaxID=334542 RepID=A0AAW6LR04_RHOSG|nr:glycosyltransferase family 39 protein [Rhodococcus qingshengii]MDE8647607.1 glycosyltransferase family 39 protein [Rhodococcus qingshengii]
MTSVPQSQIALTTPAGTDNATELDQPSIAPFARGPVLAITAAVSVVLVVISGRVGYFGDELYFLVAGRNLDWSYADQGPIVPLLAHLMDTIFPGSMAGLRIPATLLCAAGIVAAAFVARELGGDRKAQTLTAAAYALSAMAGSHTLNTGTVDMLMWTLVTLLLVRWVRLREDWLLIALGVTTAVALQNKWLIVAFWAVTAVSVLAVGPRDLLRRPALWIGAAIAALTTLPALIWQITHGWPQLSVADAIPKDGFMNYRLVFVPLAVTSAGILFGVALVCFGLWRLLRSPHLQPYRFLAWTFLGLAALFLIFGGRSGYMAGMFTVCWAAGAVELQRRPPRRGFGWMFGTTSIVISALIALTWLPVLPSSWTTPATPNTLMMSGLPEVADVIADAYHSLPPEARENSAVVSEWYWDAALVNRYGPERGLPDAYSPHRGMWDFGPPSAETQNVLFIDSDPDYLRQYFANVQPLTSITSGGMANLFSEPIPVWLCSGPLQPWSQMWTEMRHF